ncbi:MAG: hypothetical protein HDS73_02825 [Bacteroidales bacterium]|nr:hypothetical protein [Bacteroidales bacterium]
MSEKEKQELRDKICQGLKQSYKDLVKRNAQAGAEMVIGDSMGNPKTVKASDLL